MKEVDRRQYCVCTKYMHNREDAFRDRGVLKRLEGKREKNCIVCSNNDRRKRSRTICGRCRKGIHPVCLRNQRCRAEQ
jgi:hypothetical protein